MVSDHSISIVSGIWLYFIEYRHTSQIKRRSGYALVLLGMPIIVSVLVLRAQFPMSGPDYFGTEMLELTLFFLVVSIEAICISKGIRRVTPVHRVFSFVPFYVLSLWLVSLPTIVIAGLIYPGS